MTAFHVKSYYLIPGVGYYDAIFVYSDTGVLHPGWPQPAFVDGPVGSRAAGSVNGYSFGDLDGDGVPELVAITGAGLDCYMGLFAWHLDGTLVPGFPVRIPGSQAQGDPVIGDIDGDGKPEILFVGSIYWGITDVVIFAYHNDGTPVNLFPMDFGGLGDAISVQTPTLEDVNGDGKLDIVTSAERVPSYIYVITLGTPYNRDNIEWPTMHFDNMRTGWYRKWAHVDKATSWIETSAPAIPGDKQSSVWITAHGIRPNAQPILWPDQFVRFGRLPDAGGGEFSTFIDNGNGSWSQKLTAPYVQDPVTVTVSSWINEFKLNQTVSVTFWGKPRITSITPRAFPTGSFIDSTLTGANLGLGVTLRALDPDLTISNVTRTTETGMTARFSVPAGAISGPRYFVANAYGRDSAPQWVLAYDPNDLFLVLDKTAGTTITWYGRSSPSYTLMRDTTPTFATGTPIYTGPAMTTTDPANASYFYLIF